MYFDTIIGHTHLLNHLKKATENGRIPHAQLFVGKEGVGTLQVAIAYASLLISQGNKNPESSRLKCQKWQHPDLHFAFPTAINETVKTKPVSNLFLGDWRSFLTTHPFGSLFDWFQQLGIENKQGQMGVDEAQEIVKALQLKPYEGTFQVMIIWMPEKMNTAASNKLLKLLEEPPYKTIFILVTENEEELISTIKSRCQALYFGNLSVKHIADFLIDHKAIDPNTALKIAHQSDGSMNKAIKLLQEKSDDVQFEKYFINWVRAAFRAKGNAAVINDLVQWSNEIASLGRETQKQFLSYCIQFFRQSLLHNYQAHSLVFIEPKTDGFKLEKFAPFVHNGNVMEIVEEIENAIYHIESNGNQKIILLDMSIKLTRLLHAKEVISS